MLASSMGCPFEFWVGNDKARACPGLGGLASGARGAGDAAVARLDLADQVQRGLQRLGAFAPLGGADFTRMRSHVLGGLQAAQRFLGVAADAVVVRIDRLDAAV